MPHNHIQYAGYLNTSCMCDILSNSFFKHQTSGSNSPSFFLPDTLMLAQCSHPPTHCCHPYYSQRVVIPGLSQNGTIRLSVRFMPNLMSPCRTCFGGEFRTEEPSPGRSDIPPCVITRKSHWQLEGHLGRSPSYSNQSATYAVNNFLLSTSGDFLHTFILHQHDSFLCLWAAPSVISASLGLPLQYNWQPLVIQ